MSRGEDSNLFLDTRTPSTKIRGMDTTTTLNQIGRMNLLAISGGRWSLVSGTLVLPVGAGYSVEVDLDEGSDTYTVRRMFRRGGKAFPKGEQTYVYCDEVGEVAYRASSFRSYAFGDAA